MKAKSKVPASPLSINSCKVFWAGAILKSTLSSTLASAHLFLASRVYSSLTSHAITFPSFGRAKAAASDDAPVKTPTSITYQEKEDFLKQIINCRKILHTVKNLIRLAL